MGKMNIIYFGSSDFSRLVLEGIIQRDIKPVLVISQPDSPQGRGLRVKPTPVKEFSLLKQIPVHTPYSLKECDNIFSNLSPAVVIVVAYGKIIPKSFLNIKDILFLGVHPSLLPRYRGPAPINWAIINGEKETGITIFRINNIVDAGDILLQRKIDIKREDNFITLKYKLAVLSVDVIVSALQLIYDKKAVFVPQDDTYYSYAPKLRKEDGRISWYFGALNIENMVKGLLPWPCAYTFYKGRIIKIWEALAIESEDNHIPGEVVNLGKEGITVGTGDGLLLIKKLQPQNSKIMDANSFVCGYRIGRGDRFTEEL